MKSQRVKLIATRRPAEVQHLARLYEALAGKRPTEAEIRAARELLEGGATISPRIKGQG
jgi:hypothetical protein